jgi:heme-degrading monooxygenase HmoA
MARPAARLRVLLLGYGCDNGAMTVVRINAIDVADGRGEELARRFAARAGAVDDADGFEGFELLRPTDGRSTWLVVTRWRDQAAFEAWVASPAFAHGHRGPGPAADGSPPPPVGTHSELWSYDIVDLPAVADRGGGAGRGGGAPGLRARRPV